jgi:hypothetical protein
MIKKMNIGMRKPRAVPDSVTRPLLRAAAWLAVSRGKRRRWFGRDGMALFPPLRYLEIFRSGTRSDSTSRIVLRYDCMKSMVSQSSRNVFHVQPVRILLLIFKANNSNQSRC